MKEVVKFKEEIKLTKSEVIFAAITHTAAGVLGLLSSRAAVLGSMLPFGISFVAGVNLTYLPSCAVGVFLGYFFPNSDGSGFRYIASMLAVFAIRLMLSHYKKISESPLFLAFIALLANAITGAVSLNYGKSAAGSFFTECILSFAGAYFLSKAQKALNYKANISPFELSYILFSLSVLLLGTNEISLYGVGMFRVLGVFIILVSARFGGVLAGALSGVFLSAASAMSHGEGYTFIAFSLGGVLAGTFSKKGRFIQIFSFFSAVIISIFVLSANYLSVAFVVESIIGIMLFVMLPNGASVTLGKWFYTSQNVPSAEGVKKALDMRMNMAANALTQVTHTLEQVSNRLSEINAPDFESVISAVERKACLGCKLQIFCFENRRDKTVEAIISLGKNEENENKNTIEEIKGRCTRFRTLEETSKAEYGRYVAKITAENRIKEVRQMVTEQFCGMADMLKDMADEFNRDKQFDLAAANKVFAALKEINLTAEECSCKIDRYGRMTVDISLNKNPESAINKLQLMKTVSVTAQREFGVPTVTKSGEKIYITLTEHPEFTVDIGIAQINATGDMCGDSYSVFNKSDGKYVAILSDGMGTGGRAAVDSAMAVGILTKLLKAGFGFDCSLKMLNSSMLFKSSDESLATVDIASVDLFTGEAELYKAGAAPTVIRRNGKTGRAESSSLPIGILQSVGFDKASIKLKGNDILVLTSDGATDSGIDWIREELECFSSGKAQDLAEHIANCALRRRNDGHLDDITVMTMVLEKNP